MKIFKFTPPWRGKQKNNGFTLVETLVAVSIFTMSILGLLIVLSGGISDTSYAKKKIIASYLAQEGIEYARNMRDTAVLYNATSPQGGWNNFKSANVSYPSNDSNFIRNVSMTPVNADEVRISSDVSWTQGSGNYNITFSEDLFNWVE
jgi:Tfp pilus assembly protein PilV